MELFHDIRRVTTPLIDYINGDTLNTEFRIEAYMRNMNTDQEVKIHSCLDMKSRTITSILTAPISDLHPNWYDILEAAFSVLINSNKQ